MQYILLSKMFFYQLVETLERNGIPYIIAGGYAVALHGYVRKTFDIDLITDTSLEGLIEIEFALKECGLRPLKYGAGNAHKLKSVESSWYFINPKDDLQRVDVNLGLDFNKFIATAKTTRIQSYSVPIIGFDDLLELKKSSSLEKDKTDLEQLLEISR